MSLSSIQSIQATIPVIADTAYRAARLKLQGTLAAVGVAETQRAAAVAEFSNLYRALPTGHLLDLKITVNDQTTSLQIECHVPLNSLNALKAQCIHFSFQQCLDKSNISDSQSALIRLERKYQTHAEVNLDEARKWLAGSTAEELRLKSAQIEEANAAKREFLSRMSHELRTPMNAIIGMTHLALRTDLDKRQRDYLDKINAAGQNLLGIINDVLDFSKIEAGKLAFEQADFQLDQVLGNVSNLVAEKIFSKGLELLFSVDSNVPRWLNGDSLRLSQVLINLISNATKFTEEGTITLRVTQLKSSPTQIELQFSVQDTGIGMTEVQIANLFQAFAQADVSTTRRYGGTGLGLSICKRLLELMGGGISVTSKLGEGSCFKARACFLPGKQLPAKVVPAALNQLRVLVVDDNPVACEVMQGLLAHLPLYCDTCTSGEEALRLIDGGWQRNQPYALLLLDWQLGSGLDGLDVARQIRANQKLQQPRIVLVTAYGRDLLTEETEARHLDAFLSKPVRPSDLIDTLINLFSPEEKKERGPDGESVLAGVSNLLESSNGKQDLNLAGIRVLLVEDNEINRQIACELLDIVGARVFTATNGIEALAWLERHSGRASQEVQSSEQINQYPCDLVLMDLNMPEMDGWACVKQIRAQSRWQELPVLAMTAHAMEQERERCLAIGMQDHIGKPINPDHLYAKLRQWSRHTAAGDTAKKGKESEQRDQMRRDNIDSEIGHLNGYGFDVKGALGRVGGNASLYKRLLLSMMRTQIDVDQRLDQALSQNDLNEAQHIVHTLKGVAANLGATALADAAGCLENALKQGHGPLTLRRHLNDQLNVALAAIRESLGADLPSPQEDELAEGPDQQQINTTTKLAKEQVDLLQKLDRLLGSCDGEALEVVDHESANLMAILNSKGYSAVALHTQGFNFEAAREALRRFTPGGLNTTQGP